MFNLPARAWIGRTVSLALLATSTGLAGCATGREPSLPAVADYNRPCSDLIVAYEQADKKAQDRKALSSTSDLAIGAATIVLALTSQVGAGVSVGAIALSYLKGDLGAAEKTRKRDELRMLAVRKDCTADDVEQRRSERKQQAIAPSRAAAR